ncbi:Serine protease inhibitor A3L [Armadillidium nasatum]|uniref:Serine protease inhibitor A3L n=1 Tax=Armadillidium nasatum TaxID=96803 RepID=A0A5N5T5V8_9CRUS|nr:Serine protease inhibitor A3L [Armadillidium nasatum]
MSSAENLTKECPIITAINGISKQISFNQMEKSPESNVALSALSIGALLNLLYLGTVGDTKIEIKKAFKYPEEFSIHSILSENGVKISFKTRLFVQKEFPILESFKSISEASFITEVEKLDFKGSPDAAKDRINAWVSESTEGKIDKIFGGPLPLFTKLIAVNTLLFNASWKFPFNPNSTKGRIFFTGKENITIPMMENEIEIPYLIDEKLGLEMISLPYEGNRFCMLLLKLKGKPERDYFKKMNSIPEMDDLRILINRMGNRKVLVRIPKMKLDSDLNLAEDLKSIGIKKLFDSSAADFGGLSSEKGIIVDDILHKAIIEVSETRTVAAAVSPIAVFLSDFPVTNFELDKPFALVIRDMKFGINLFSAKVWKPEELN